MRPSRCAMRRGGYPFMKKPKQRQPKLRTMVAFNTGTRRHKSKRDYSRKVKQDYAAEAV
jgi:hypothetical protein